MKAKNKKLERENFLIMFIILLFKIRGQYHGFGSCNSNEHGSFPNPQPSFKTRTFWRPDNIRWAGTVPYLLLKINRN